MPHININNMAAAADAATDSLTNIPDDISITYLPNVENVAERIIKRSLNYYTQGYIHKIKIYDSFKPLVRVTARCWRSMKKSEKPHDLHIELNVSDKKMTESYCSCKVGLSGHCSHVLGLVKSLQGFKLNSFKSVPDQLSCTSMPQQWHMPRGEKISPSPINHLIVAKPTETRKRKPVLCQLNLQTKLPKVTNSEIESLMDAKDTPLGYVLSPDRPKVMSAFGEVQLGSILSYQTRNLKTYKPVTAHGCGNISLNGVPPVKLPEQYSSLKAQFLVEDPVKLEKSTRMQSDSKLWHEARKNRLTASNFGLVINRKSAPSEKMLERLFKTSDIQAPSLTYGKRNENKAKSKYLAMYQDRHVHECGFVVSNEFPFLGATPDGVLCDKGQFGLIEIKCPYSARNLSVLDACTSLKDFFLKRENEKVFLKKDHGYYAQVQGQLMVTGCPFCDFTVYFPTEENLFVQRIIPDIEFMENMLSKLSVFFQNSALPFQKKNLSDLNM